MFLSIALMVKNEEQHLERCLKSVIGLFPQIIILDTGSSDKTVEIAEKYTKHIYHQTWKNDFSLHRNKSFSYCTGDWIMQIDADEELKFIEGITPQRLLNFLENLPPEINAVGLPLKDWRESQKAYSAEYDIVRIFRKGKVKWRRKIHNESVYEGEAHYFPGCYLKHYGYDLTDEQRAAKAKRTIGLLEESLKDDPTDYQSLFYLAQCYASWKRDPKSALKVIVEYHRHKSHLGEDFNQSIYHLAATINIDFKDYNRAMYWINMGLADNVENMDLCWDLMQLGLKQKKKELIAAGAQRFTIALQNFPKTRLKQGGQFFFNNNVTSYATALYYLHIHLLENAAIEHAKLKHVLPKCSEQTQETLESKLSEISKTLGWENVNERKIIVSTADSLNQMQQPASGVKKKPGLIVVPN